jgi:hypothetical protein
MLPDDPRHGTEAGYAAHRRDLEVTCEPCRRAHRRESKLRQLYGSRKVPALGSQRRIQALQALGWSKQIIARRLGYCDNGAISYLMRSETMMPKTAAKIAAVYDEMCMVRPEGPGAKRARTWAARFGFAPPLAWDDIDNDPEPAKAPPLGRWHDHIDEALVMRVVNGGTRPRKLTPAEGAEVVRQMRARGYDGAEIERLTGVNVQRYREAS